MKKRKGLARTEGMDLYRVLWMKAPSSEAWLERRTNFSRSLAVMSMVGHILGLGDRHPSNLMLDRLTGKILHIDFGDCFEVAMHRDKFPETVPFRLTRMLVQAMEVSAIEGTFRSTCELVMGVLRANKDSLMAMLEAFIHDPLIKWRLLQSQPVAAPSRRPSAPSVPSIGSRGASTGRPLDVGAAEAGVPSLPHSLRVSIEESLGYSAPPDRLQASLIEQFPTPLDRVVRRAWAAQSSQHVEVAEGSHEPQALNERAVRVIRRVVNKLTGREFGDELTVSQQVQCLIEQATSHQNLCQCYIGWCPFW